MSKIIPIFNFEDEKDMEKNNFNIVDNYEEKGGNKYDGYDIEVFKSELTEKFSKKFSELEDCDEDEQKQKIEEIRRIVEKMCRKEFESIFTIEMLNKANKMIEEKNLTMEKSISLMKHIGYCKMLKNMRISEFRKTSLSKRFEKMITDEKRKNEKDKDEKLLVDLCECNVFLFNELSSESISFCVPYLLKVALNKEENEEVQKETELALLALSNIGKFEKVRKGLFLDKIKEIIKYHQENFNLTHLAYQSAWDFLILRLFRDHCLNGAIAEELHFAREAARELEELARNVNWSRKEEETEDLFILMKWLRLFDTFLSSNKLWNERNVELISSIIQLLRMAKENNEEISHWCIYSLRMFAENRDTRIGGLLKGGVVDVFLEEIRRATFKDEHIGEYFEFFEVICEMLKGKTGDETEEAKRKAAKIELFEKMEEEGYEDCIAGLLLFFVKEIIGDDNLTSNAEFLHVRL